MVNYAGSTGMHAFGYTLNSAHTHTRTHTYTHTHTHTLTLTH